ncbi:hypothetical protein [Trichocoleus sp. AS-A1]|uniref:hypothetical protein n=1 Tax=Trichocoleus sp. AS-A1 TaxID=2933921 RepID=UPI00329A729F
MTNRYSEKLLSCGNKDFSSCCGSGGKQRNRKQLDDPSKLSSLLSEHISEGFDEEGARFETG